ncbi:hypothetical protein V5799_024240 [Amblyomma americanum]|uniref:Uncharacterized protein n=1 Tax=Amblyomma americanum TaxID=6943 RepID=A0AAQ4ECP0_AMBAM
MQAVMWFRSSLSGSAVVRQLMSLTVPEDSVEEVLDFVKNAILDAMSAENTRQSTRSSSGRPPEDEAIERRVAAARAEAFRATGVDELPDDAASPLSLVALVRLIEEEVVADAEALYRPARCPPVERTTSETFATGSGQQSTGNTA